MQPVGSCARRCQQRLAFRIVRAVLALPRQVRHLRSISTIDWSPNHADNRTAPQRPHTTTAAAAQPPEVHRQQQPPGRERMPTAEEAL